MYNLVNSFEMPKLDIERFERDDDSPVYMEIDEDHMKCRRSKNTYMRMVSIHRGIEEICRDRNKLIDKHTIMFPASVPLEEVSEYVLNYLEKRYNTGGLRKITLQNLKIFMRISRKRRM